MKPAWIEGLLGESFFGGCGVHENKRKNEKNIFCLDCCLSFCPHCLPSHRSHPLLQVRRYLYQDVIRLDELEKLIDCSYIQSYTINGAKVIFLTQRAQSRACKGSVNTCYTCDRILQDPFNFCSLSCKVNYMVYQGQDLSSMLYGFSNTHFGGFSQSQALQMEDSREYAQIAPGSILEPSSSENSIFYSSREIGMVNRNTNNNNTGTTGFLHDEDSIFPFSSRRKGAPHRSPLS